MGMYEWFLENWISLVAVALSLAAALYARRANRLVGVYARAIWRLEWNLEALQPTLRLVNRGASPALNVQVRLDVDPMQTLGVLELWPMIGVGEWEEFTLLPPRTGHGTPNETAGAWQAFFAPAERRMATVTWTDLEDGDVEQRIAIPAEWTVGLPGGAGWPTSNT